MTEKYPEIGSQCSYIRSNAEGGTLVGFGTVTAVLLDPRGRVMVQVKDKQNTYNVDIMTINQDEAFHKKYTKAIEDVQRISKEGNDAIAKVAAEYNEQVDAIYNALLGDPIELVLPEAPQKAEKAA